MAKSYFVINFTLTGTATKNLTAMFVAIAVSFAVLIIILFITVITCKRRRQASKLSSSVNTVEIQNETAQTAEESPNYEVCKDIILNLLV